jgi:antitoxin HigA-1
MYRIAWIFVPFRKIGTKQIVLRAEANNFAEMITLTRFKLLIITEVYKMEKNRLLPPITPGEILREDFMEPRNLSINQLPKNIGVPQNRISEIVKEKRAITADTALRLQRFFGVEAQFWLNLQSEFVLRITKRQKWLDIERYITPIKYKASDPLEKAVPA